ncbi:hypothetical protein PIB30_095482 [Stylosanthes scabra]|uniref:Myb-like domain-containing protein n=1 Tax=Stylosanthes scabra TaxID=79078 RepID=A0ABU6XXE4_9FABA|nr:hypothetical protein [Stylosanthes scabra]
MQLGDPTVLEASSTEAVEGGGEAIGSAMSEVEKEMIVKEGGGSGGEGGGDEGEKMNSGGNRWPRQETLALLKIRSDMDAVFRDSSLKGPLWEDVSRKLGELGYHRSAKKCKEKFENVYKYHKRTKESRSAKSEGKTKTYKFFDQLQALENQFTLSYNHNPPSKPQPPPPPPPTLPPTNILPLLPTRPSDTTTTTAAATTTTTTPIIISYATTVPSTNPTPPLVTNPNPPPSQQQLNNNNNNNESSVHHQHSLSIMNNLFSSTSTSSSTASDEDLEEKYRKKRKWKEYFRRLTRQVLTKQEEMQKRFLEAIEKREREQVAQQDAWRMQEMARINREHDILVQERSTAAAKDAAVITFLQKISGQQTPPPPTITVSFQQPPPPQQPEPQPQPQPQPQPALMAKNNLELLQKVTKNGSESAGPLLRNSSSASSRWPKAEVHALIRLRTSMEPKYQENGPKAPLWEDISAGMQRLGYNRSAKRCKEKWENINKYFKKVKESKKQRREDSKTCPYFHELDALYREKSSKGQNNNNNPFSLMEPLMVQPEQQWRPPPQNHQDKNDNNDESRKREREYDEEEEEEEDDDGVLDNEDDGDGDSAEDEGANRYEIATNKLSSVDTVE